MEQASTLTPMFRQYRSLKEAQPESILLFRMGDFYEMFYDDARIASRLLELTLTARGRGTEHVVPMCGFPYHQLDAYTARLVRAKRKVAICDQVEDPRKAVGLVRREVVRVVTPGTVIDPEQLEAKANSWIAAVVEIGGRPGAAFLDASTGELLAWEPGVEDTDGWRALADRLQAFGPSEIVHPEGARTVTEFLATHAGDAVLSPAEPYPFDIATASAALCRVLRVAALDGYGLRDRTLAVAACGGLLQYLEDVQKSGLGQIDRVVFHEPANHLLLDPATRRNLEIERGIREGSRIGSLLEAVDSTVTAVGGRLLRRWLTAPLLDPVAIGQRLDAVEELLRRLELRQESRRLLEGVHDLERLLTRAVAGAAGPRELIALGASLGRCPELCARLEPARSELVRTTLDGLDLCDDVRARIASAIADDPPLALKDGGVMRDGYDAALDELRSIRRDGRSFIASLEDKERQATGIGSLKVRFNKVFGYFVEVSKANLHLVPEHYLRKQTVASAERYITPELKEYEAKVLGAQERIEALELELFTKLRLEVAAEATRIKAVARAVALVDVLAAFAETAAVCGYCRPEIDSGPGLAIESGRHPVVENAIGRERFVPNDTTLESAGRAIAVLTGPNMGGKSTYLRQVAIIALLAQAGSFVPAKRARLGVFDRIFCRVGASDNLAEGHSTFMVEMTETANILHHATRRSLVLLDEIGRGTSTFDGLSIAWAVVEHLSALPGGAPRTLFATHYHELTELAAELPSVVNLRMAVRESGEDVAFLHRVERGASDRSYGIHVARLAGVPPTVVARAREILANIERDEYGRDGQPRRSRSNRRVLPGQPTLFELELPPPPPAPTGGVAEVIATLERLEPNALTPLEALNALADLKAKL